MNSLTENQKQLIRMARKHGVNVRAAKDGVEVELPLVDLASHATVYETRFVRSRGELMSWLGY